MSEKLNIIVLIACILFLPCVAGAVEVAPRISDREIVESLAELKEQQKALNQRMDDMMINFNKRFESIDKRFESIDKRFESIHASLTSLTNLVIGMFSSIMALIIALIGYMIWDRRTAQKPLREKMTSLEENAKQLNKQLEINNPSGPLLERLVAAFRELAKTDGKVADVLRSFSLL